MRRTYGKEVFALLSVEEKIDVLVAAKAVDNVPEEYDRLSEFAQFVDAERREARARLAEKNVEIAKIRMLRIPILLQNLQPESPYRLDSAKTIAEHERTKFAMRFLVAETTLDRVGKFLDGIAAKVAETTLVRILGRERCASEPETDPYRVEGEIEW